MINFNHLCDLKSWHYWMIPKNNPKFRKAKLDKSHYDILSLTNSFLTALHFTVMEVYLFINKGQWSPIGHIIYMY